MLLILVAIQIILFQLATASKCAYYLTSTAVVSEPDGIARIECWQFDQQFNQYPTVGMSMPFGDVTNITYVVLPPRSSEGIHNPPSLMMFVLLSGMAHVTLPDGDDDVWIVEGINGFLVAADVTGKGHYTDYPSNKETVALQIPFKDGKIPAHKILHSGACKSVSQVRHDCDDAFQDETSVHRNLLYSEASRLGLK